VSWASRPASCLTAVRAAGTPRPAAAKTSELRER